MRFNFDTVDWDMTTKISFLQRRVIVACIAYYELDATVISDTDYKELAEQLVEYQTANSEDAAKSTYYYVMKDFDVSTGFDVYDKLNDYDKDWLMMITRVVIGNQRKD